MAGQVGRGNGVPEPPPSLSQQGWRKRAQLGARVWEWVECVPSEESDAPESLKSSVPIWIGKTRSWGRILGILEIEASVCSLGGVLKSGEVSIVRKTLPQPHTAAKMLVG